MLAATAAAAAPPAGRLDPRFGGDGLVIHRLTKGHDVARGLVPLPCERLAKAAGLDGHDTGPDAVLLRLQPNGGRDRVAAGGSAKPQAGFHSSLLSDAAAVRAR